MELELLKIKRQSDKEVHVTLTPIKQEIEQDRETWLETVNLHLEGLIDKANRDKKILRHMAYHYMARNKICNMRIRKLKARLRRALEVKKEKDRLKMLAKASLANQSTSWWCSMPNLGKF